LGGEREDRRQPRLGDMRRLVRAAPGSFGSLSALGGPAAEWQASESRDESAEGQPDENEEAVMIESLWENAADGLDVLEDDGVLDASDTLDTDPIRDPLDTGIAPPDRWSPAERFGATLAEQRRGQSLDQLLAEEEPDADPYAADWDVFDEDQRFAPMQPRAGRLVADYEVADPVHAAGLVARDAGIDAGAASAEEAAVRIVYGG
jgi:Family of unknown function (DUF5709)